jgi:hypothetical protein
VIPPEGCTSCRNSVRSRSSVGTRRVAQATTAELQSVARSSSSRYFRSSWTATVVDQRPPRPSGSSVATAEPPSCQLPPGTRATARSDDDLRKLRLRAQLTAGGSSAALRAPGSAPTLCLGSFATLLGLLSVEPVQHCGYRPPAHRPATRYNQPHPEAGSTRAERRHRMVDRGGPRGTTAVLEHHLRRRHGLNR